MDKTYKSCSFTGHRAIPSHLSDRLKGFLSFEILAAYECGVREFYCGGALGFDTMAAEAVIAFRVTHPDVRLGLVLPCRDQDSSWSESTRLVYREILSEADYVEYVTDTYFDGCMKLRNQRLVALCDLLIAYTARPRSGAGQTVRLAEQAGRRVINLGDWIE